MADVGNNSHCLFENPLVDGIRRNKENLIKLSGILTIKPSDDASFLEVKHIRSISGIRLFITLPHVSCTY